MNLQIFPRKSGISLAVPLALVLLIAAAPVSGQSAETESDLKEPKGTLEEPSGTQDTQSAAPKDQVEVTADRVRQPLPEPDLTQRLPRLFLTDMKPWNWNGMWHASEWANGDSTIPWKYGRVRQSFGGDTHFVLTSKGAPELKAQKGHPKWAKGLYEVDVSIPAMRPGLIASPILLYNDKTEESIAVQIVGQRHMQITINGAVDGGERRAEEHRIAGDFSGRRMRVAIRRHTSLGLIDIFLDGELVHSFNEESPAFPKSAMRPVISLYAADKHGWAKQWAGTWQPLAGSDRIRMTVHGYNITPL